MNILFLIQRQQARGVETFTGQLADRLLDLGHTVTIITLFSNVQCIKTTARIIELNANPNLRWLDVKTWFRLAQVIKRLGSIDLIQANAGDTLKYAVLSKFIFRWDAPIIFRNASTISAYINSRPIKLINGWLLSKTDAILSVSEFSKTDLVTLFPKLADRAHVVPIGIIPKAITPVNTEKQYILHVGGFTFEKNHEAFLTIMPVLWDLYPDLELWLIGEGPLREGFEQKVLSLGYGEKIKLLGTKTNVLDYMASAKAFVFPSIIEGLPAVLLEAMWAGVPIAAYNVGGISELIENEKTGYLVKLNDAHGMVESIKKCLQEDNQNLVNKARALVQGRYLMDKIAREFDGFYIQFREREINLQGL